MSFTDKPECEYAESHHIYISELGNVYIPNTGVYIGSNVSIRYEKYPWIEKFEIDGIKAMPAKRTGFGEKGFNSFVQSLNAIYANAFSDYQKIVEKGIVSKNVKREKKLKSKTSNAEIRLHKKYFQHVTEHFLNLYSAGSYNKMYAKYCGLVENMWREGEEEIYKLVMNTIIPLLKDDKHTVNDNETATAYEFFLQNITEEFNLHIKNSQNLVKNTKK